MSKIRLGLLGCGRIAEMHLKAIKEQSHLYELIAVADEFQDRAQQVGTQLAVNSHLSLQGMLKAEQLDLVVLCTPSGLHPAQAKACAEAGVACLSEKPLGCFYKEAREVVDFFDKKRVPLFVSYQTRYNPIIQKVKKWCDEGKLGKLYLIQANVFWQRPQSYYDVSPWRGSRQMDGGALMNQACHYVDLTQWFGGEVESVKGELSTLDRRIECEDTGAALIRFKSNAIGVIAVTMLTYPENQEGSITIIAENATIKIGGKSLNKLEVCKAKDPSVMIDDDMQNFDPANGYGSGHSEYYNRMSQFMKQPNHPEAISGHEGLKSLKILANIYGE
jgi:UDP-N-acetyl-2-amino-2-deoxyglucuronate dehydrogenase